MNETENTNFESNKMQMEETKLGEKLLDSATKNTIALVMILIMCIPLFNVETYSTELTSYEAALEYLF